MAGDTDIEARLDQVDDRVTALEHTTWGVRGDNGMVVALRELTAEVRARHAADDRRREEEVKRREEEAKDQRNRDRAAVLAAVTSLVAAIGIIVTLVVVLTTVA